MKTPIELLNEKCPIMVINFHTQPSTKTIFVLNREFPDMEKTFLKFEETYAIETYQQVEHLTPHSTRTNLKFALYPKKFAIKTDLISRVNFITKDDAEYAGANEMLCGLYAKHTGIDLPPEKKIEIAS